MITKYCVTYLRRDGIRTFAAPANQGHYFHDTQEEAEQHMRDMIENTPQDTFTQIFGPYSWQTFKVLPHEAYDHGDLTGHYFPNESGITRTFHFNTGVRKQDPSHQPAGIDSGNGVYHIPFDCIDVPPQAVFKYACNNPDLKPGNPLVLVREIHNSQIVSKYAYFQL